MQIESVPIAITTIAAARAKAMVDLNKRGNHIVALLEQYYVPAAIAEKIVDHAVKAQCKNPKWKPEKVVRRTVEYFKLKKKGAR